MCSIATRGRADSDHDYVSSPRNGPKQPVGAQNNLKWPTFDRKFSRNNLFGCQTAVMNSSHRGFMDTPLTPTPPEIGTRRSPQAFRTSQHKTLLNCLAFFQRSGAPCALC